MIQNSTIMVIGSSRGLGKEISNLLIKNYKFKRLIVTSRNIENLNDLKFDDILQIKFDLSDRPALFFENEFYKMLCNEEKIDYIFYCASPYCNERIKVASKENLVDSANVIANDFICLRELALKMSSEGCLIVSGAVGSERVNGFTSYPKNGMGNISFGTLHSLHKGQVKDIMCCLYQEFPEKRIIHTNISEFKDEVDQSLADDCLTTRFVAEKLLFLALNDIKLDSFSFDIFSNSVADRVDFIRKMNVKAENLTSIDCNLSRENETKRNFSKYYQKLAKIQKNKAPGTLISINNSTLAINLFTLLPEDVQNDILSSLIEFKANQIQIKKGNLELSKYIIIRIFIIFIYMYFYDVIFVGAKTF
jgi:hypothetical protein